MRHHLPAVSVQPLESSVSKRRIKTARAVFGLAGVFLALCAAAATSSDDIAAAIADPARPPGDTQRDAERKPAAVLGFIGVKRGDRIADYAVGAGYFTRLFAGVVGANGHVYGSVPSALFEYPNIVKGISEVQTFARTHAQVSVNFAAALDAAKYPEPLNVF